MATEAARAASSRISIKKELRDRDLLVAFFASLFLQVYLSRAFKGLFPLVAAELLGFAAIASMLQRLGSDRILRPSDYVAIAFGGVALVHPWSRVRRISTDSSWSV